MLSLYTDGQREPEGLLKVYIQNEFNNNIVINANVLLKSYKQQKLYLCKQNLTVQKKYFMLPSLIFSSLWLRLPKFNTD